MSAATDAVESLSPAEQSANCSAAIADWLAVHLWPMYVFDKWCVAEATCEALDERRVMRACYRLRRNAPAGAQRLPAGVSQEARSHDAKSRVAGA